jgi:hypothetical protein
MENINRTIYGSYLQTCMLMKLPFQMLANSTLNERFGVQQGVAPADGELPAFGYHVIGNGGHKMTMGANGIAKPEPVQHKGTDASLYSPIPFVLREQGNDLSPEQRERYALRRTETHGGVPYFAYYARRVDFSTTIPTPQLIQVQNGVETERAFVPDSSNLNPVPPTLQPTGVNIVSGDYCAVSAQVVLRLTNDEINELKNVAKILYDDEEYAIISEIGLVSGVDKWVSSPGPNSGTISQNEVIAAQIISFINTFYPLAFINNEVETMLDVGATEPMFSLE